MLNSTGGKSSSTQNIKPKKAVSVQYTENIYLHYFRNDKFCYILYGCETSQILLETSHP